MRVIPRIWARLTNQNESHPGAESAKEVCLLVFRSQPFVCANHFQSDSLIFMMLSFCGIHHEHHLLSHSSESDYTRIHVRGAAYEIFLRLLRLRGLRVDTGLSNREPQ
jgi:hypothetical protein